MYQFKNQRTESSVKFYQKKWFKITTIVLAILFIGGVFFAWKTGSTLNKISKGNLFGSIVRSIPGVEKNLKGEKEGRINIAVLGMRGENIPGGGLLADTIIVASIKPQENKISMISIPRDLYVTVPGTSDKQKINAVHFYGEEKGKGQGLEDMQTALEEVLGIPIHYATSINFKGFTELIDAIGGVEITLKESFSEPLQFQEERVCDPNVFTIPTGNYEYKKNEKGKIVAQYPLCKNPDVECGGEFNLPAGKQTLDGKTALCFVRSRKTSSDFERAKRQQLLIKSIRTKLLATGTLTDYNKLSGILKSLGDNVRSNLELWEMKKFYDIYSQMGEPQLSQRVLENSQEGFLYQPPLTKETGYILLPIGDNYNKIHEMAQNIFDLPAQSDIEPK